MQKTILLALLLACGTAQASEWVSLGKNGQGAEALVDVSSIRIAGNIRRVWTKVIFTTHTHKGVNEYANKWVNYELGHDAFDCGNETQRNEALNIYFEDKTNYTVPLAPAATNWDPVPPDSLLSAEMRLVCTWNPK